MTLTDVHARSAHVLLLADGVLELGGGALLSGLREAEWQGRAILLTRSPRCALVQAVERACFAAVLTKPVGRLDLLSALAKRS